MDVRIIANYLIQKYLLYRVEGKKIACTRMKIGKLLTIVQILSIKCRGEIAFDDIIVSETTGTSVPILSVYRYPYEILEIHTEESLKTGLFQTEPDYFIQNDRLIAQQLQKVDAEVPKFYAVQETMVSSLNTIIDAVFIEFGAYDSYDLGAYINEFKNEICTEEVVDTYKVRTWISMLQSQKIPDNKLIEFIANYVF